VTYSFSFFALNDFLSVASYRTLVARHTFQLRYIDAIQVSVGFWPSCVERMQLLGALRFCRRVNLVSENVVCLSPGDGEIQAGQQLCQSFTFSAF
jgi:hypothetical protein